MRLVAKLPLLFFSGCAAWSATGCKETNTFQPPPPPSVTVAKPVVQTVTNYVEETGTTEATDYAEIRARVRGYLQEIQFQPNDEVTKGQPLYVIEPDFYQAKVDQAKAAVEQANAGLERATASKVVAEADYANALAKLNRAKPLYEKGAVTKEELDERIAEEKVAAAAIEAATAAIAGAKATIAEANAALQDAELDLSYTTVVAPIDGRIDKTNVYVGNLVDDVSATHLTTIVKYDPIYATFNISERALLQLMDDPERDRGDRSKYADVKFYLGREIDEGFPFVGQLDYVDLAVDQSTGTYKIRGVFSNPGPRWQLVPGLFVKIRIPMGQQKDAILVPERALASDQLGKYLLVVNSENKVERRDVTVGLKVDSMVVIEKGLDGQDRVVVDGIQRARVGANVVPEETTLTPPKVEMETSTPPAASDVTEVTPSPDAKPAAIDSGASTN